MKKRYGENRRKDREKIVTSETNKQLYKKNKKKNRETERIREKNKEKESIKAQFHRLLFDFWSVHGPWIVWNKNQRGLLRYLPQVISSERP